MNPDLVFFTTYQCPRCHFALEADSAEGPPTWLRCPHCGRASLPPEIVRRAPSVVALDQAHAISIDPALMPDDPGLLRPRPMAARPLQEAPQASTLRLILGSGFFLTILFCVFSLLGGDWIRALIHAVAAAFLLFILSRPARPSPME